MKDILEIIFEFCGVVAISQIYSYRLEVKAWFKNVLKREKALADKYLTKVMAELSDKDKGGKNE